jgi:hypothetical protein
MHYNCLRKKLLPNNLKKHSFPAILLFLTGFASPLFSAGDVREFETVANEINKIHFIHGTKAKSLVNQLYAIASGHPEQLSLFAECFYWEAYLNYSQGINDSTLISRTEKALEMPEIKPLLFEQALLLHALALSNVVDGDYAAGLVHALQALAQFRQCGNQLFEARVQQLLGVICYRTRNFDMAEYFCRESLSPLALIFIFKNAMS